DITTTGTGLNDGNWHHIAFSWNCGTPVMQVYVDGSTRTFSTTSTNNVTAVYSTTNWGFGANNAGGAKYTGDLAEFYFNQSTNLDLRVGENLRRFMNGGVPVDLGATCSAPTGSQPIWCHKGPNSFTGSDSNDGMSASTALATLQRAFDCAASNFD